MNDPNRDEAVNLRRILQNQAYVRAYEDIGLLNRTELRPVRLQLELLKAELHQQEHRIESTIVLFGSARILPPDKARDQLEVARRRAQAAPDDESCKLAVRVALNRVHLARYYEEARNFGRIVSEASQQGERLHSVITTGGGPGIMEAGNRGAWDAHAKSVGMNITLPFEQAPNAYITPDLCFLFHYFAVRKMHLLLRARAAIFFPGGFGTMDELFETLTLVQTGKARPMPIVLMGRDWWERFVDFDFLVEQGTISPGDVDLITYAETAEEAWAFIGPE